MQYPTYEWHVILLQPNVARQYNFGLFKAGCHSMSPVITSPPGRVHSIAMNMSEFLSACISQKPHERLHEIFCTHYPWPWFGPPL